MHELGRLGVLQFNDLNNGINAFQRNFVQEIMRLNELERKVRFFEDQLRKESIGVNVEIDDFSGEGVEMQQFGKPWTPQDVAELETYFDDVERELLQMTAASAAIVRDLQRAAEYSSVLKVYGEFTGGMGDVDDGSFQSHLTGIAGSISKDKMGVFERVVWRLSRGNALVKHTEISIDAVDMSAEESEKCAFLILYKVCWIEMAILD